MGAAKRPLSLKIAALLYLIIAILPIAPHALLIFSSLFFTSPLGDEFSMWDLFVSGILMFELPTLIVGLLGTILIYFGKKTGFVLCLAISLLKISRLALLGSFGLSYPYLYLTPFLATLAFIFLVKKSTRDYINAKSRGSFWSPWKMAVIIPCLILLFILYPIGVTYYALNKEAIVNPDGTAPDTDFEERAKWGDSSYRKYLKYVKEWIRKSPVIESTAGNITGIAPFGYPNYFQSCFTDGCYAAMNLEVRGENGTGFLYAPYINVTNYQSKEYTLSSLGQDASWTFDGETQFVALDGRTLLESEGLSDFASELEQLFQQQKYEKAEALYEEHEEKLKKLPVALRKNFLLEYAESLEKSGNNTKASEAYLAIAQDYRRHYSFSSNFKNEEFEKEKRLEALGEARLFLQKAHRLEPELKRIKFLASQIITEQLEASKGIGYGRAPEKNLLTRDKWGKSALGDFYYVAKRYVFEARKIGDDLGRVMFVAPASGKQNDISLSSDGYYHSFMNLDVYGLFGKGLLRVSLKENKELVPAVDLFAETPRPPGSAFLLSSPEWIYGDTNVKLSARSGTVLTKKK